MRVRVSVLALLVALSPAGCQRYDLEPVAPVAVVQSTSTFIVSAQFLKPKLMLLVDRSGSMDDPIDPGNGLCQVNGVTCGSGVSPRCDTSVCPTRWSELRAALGSFLQTNGTLGRMGLLLFPNPQAGAAACAPPTLHASGGLQVELSQSNDVDSELQDSADRINAAIQAVQPGGGTPTGASLALLGEYEPLLRLESRDRYVLLLTDGLPNCNDANPADADLPGSGCTCTISSCESTPTWQNPYHRAGCLDDVVTVGAIQQLRDQGIQTIVLGFGGDVSNPAGAQVLDSMAAAGGFVRSCASDADCGAGDACDPTSWRCGRQYYEAGNAQALAEALESIRGAIDPFVCDYRLESAPSDPGLISVLLNGQSYLPGPQTWTYSWSASTITLAGDLCGMVMDSSPLHPVKVEIRVLRQVP